MSQKNTFKIIRIKTVKREVESIRRADDNLWMKNLG